MLYILFGTDTSLAANICLVDGKKRIDPPVIPEFTDRVYFNVLTSCSPTGSRACLTGRPCPPLWISARPSSSLSQPSWSVLFLQFKPMTISVCPRLLSGLSATSTMIHALMIDSVTLLQSVPPNARALQNEQMAVEELLGIYPDTWRRELRDCLVDSRWSTSRAS